MGGECPPAAGQRIVIHEAVGQCVPELAKPVGGGTYPLPQPG